MREKIGVLADLSQKELWKSRSTATMIPSASADLSKVFLPISGQADLNEDVKLETTGKSKQCIGVKQTQGKARARGLSLAATLVTNLWAAGSNLHQQSGASE